jgi:hypothetical protein
MPAASMPDAPLDLDDPALDGGDWLYQRDGQVYGPLDGRRLAELLYRGEVVGATKVSTGDGDWRPLEAVGAFLVHVKKAEAAHRVEQEVTGRRLLKARQDRTRTASLVLGAVLVVAGAGVAAFLLSKNRLERSPLLDGFGAGISIVAPARVAVASRAVEEEVEVSLDASPTASRSPRPAHGPRPAGVPAGAAGAVDGGDLVATQFDAARIQEVVSREQRTLAPCLRDEAVRAPDFAGEVPLEFTIGNEGRVVRVAVTDPRLRQGPLHDCFERVLHGDNWRFPPFPGERPNVSLTFRVGP